MIRTNFIGNVIRMRKHPFSLDKCGLVTESHLTGQPVQRKGRVAFQMSLVNTVGITIDHLCVRRRLEDPFQYQAVCQYVSGIQKKQPPAGCHAGPFIHGVVNPPVRFRDAGKGDLRAFEQRCKKIKKLLRSIVGSTVDDNIFKIFPTLTKQIFCSCTELVFRLVADRND